MLSFGVFGYGYVARLSSELGLNAPVSELSKSFATMGCSRLIVPAVVSKASLCQ